jgi:hypothetical protein
VVVATHPATQDRAKPKKKKPVGGTREGVVSELFFTNLPQQGFTACDGVELSCIAAPWNRDVQMKMKRSIPTTGLAGYGASG